MLECGDGVFLLLQLWRRVRYSLNELSICQRVYDQFLILLQKSGQVIKEKSEIWEGLKGGVDFCTSNVERKHNILRVTDITKSLRLLDAICWKLDMSYFIQPASIPTSPHSYFNLRNYSTHFVSLWWNNKHGGSFAIPNKRGSWVLPWPDPTITKQQNRNET